MIRRSPLPGRTRLPTLAVLLGSLWLAGCATQQQGLTGRDEVNPADAYTQLGVAYLERDNLQRAMAALDRALTIDPNDAEALQAMAMVYQRQGESQLADDSFKRALAADSDFTRARNNYAAFLYDQGRVREACEQLEQASQDPQYPNRAQLFANLGQCQQELGDSQAARRSLARAQDIDPRSARSYYALAMLEHAAGNHDRAQQQLDTYIRLAGPNISALRLAREIAQARGDRDAVAFYTEQLEGSRRAP
ncbi:type IV pilus biogenesis/stability protein PilW [Halomonas urumqiensis]|uniref:Type IV pilus biogenesis/stability protein PilW n=1 Tax=Halomonas urumqiensis TaxID=1684789 RepID=A0A2N7UMW5_9GAMM|nr:type IV pilus biogenesis/stability protein PilW [Halomonas urumqiensis]PMR81761.1 type IV pilus biogenesis/stability protein PilW [Halomonas urumqiensis]PTB02398.1 type IV pilus biogenesis/stability protein PilW [Halomonas urumqiensis]GHE21882.1 type IV pilus biogenesis/stability protein PilW [Halomonas urumqiensis]